MFINELYKNLELTTSISYSLIGRDGQRIRKEEEILVEHLIDVYVNEQLTMKLICMPEFLAELVLGRLLTEGIIASTEDVESIFICEFGSRARVMLKKKERSEQQDYIETTASCCTNNHILNNYFVEHKDVAPLHPIHWEEEWIFHLADAFAQGTPIHNKTRSAHSAFLAIGNDILFQCEDIGRHNALDKAIGYALRNKIDLNQCILYTSGRIPTDMVMKVIRAGVPILVGKATVTDAALELAQQFQLTLIGQARKDSMKVYKDYTLYQP